MKNIPAVEGKIIRKRLLGDVEYISAPTFTNVTGLGVTLRKKKYIFEYVLYIESESRDIKLSFAGGSATIGTYIAQVSQFKSDSGVAVDISGNTPARQTDNADEIEFARDGENTMIVVKGCLVCAVAGTFIPQACQSASDASRTAIIRGSHVIFTEVT